MEHRPITAEAPPRPAAMRRAPRLLLAGLTAVLAAAVGLQVWPTPDPEVVKRSLPLADYFPRAVAGWQGEDRPLGDTEELTRAAGRILNFDEALVRDYHRGGREFSLYVAYWRAGKMPAREIAFHVPDQCWTAVGWRQVAADYRYQRAFAGRLLAPAQYREFTALRGREYVVYWHILDGRAIIYSPDGTPSQLDTFQSLLRHGLGHKGQQYFIRLASAQPLDTLWNDPGFREILELVAPLGPGLDANAEPY